MTSATIEAPLSVYLKYLEDGKLAYQYEPNTGHAVFFPRVAAPVTGAPLEWRVSEGKGEVYATTTMHRRGELPTNLAIIALDEGFRMMSRVEGIPAEAVRIGLRVKVAIRPGEDAEPALPIFVPMDTRGPADGEEA